LIAAGRARQHH